MRILLAGILAVAAVATFADWVWYTYGIRHSLVAGVVHGAVLLTVVGAVLGAAAWRPWRGLPIGTLAGAGGALAYYAIIALTGGATYGTAIPAAWVMTWLFMAVLEGRWLRAPACRSWGEITTRAIIAATFSGVAFYLVLDTLWGAPPSGGRNYAMQFAAWAFAWTPGLLALGTDPHRRQR